MQTKILILFSGLLIFLFFAVEVFACSCQISRPCTMDARADGMLIGKIESVVKKGNMAVHQVKVEKNYERFAGKDTIEIYTDQYSSCSYSMREGQTYVIFAKINDKSGIITTGYCSGTKTVSRAKKEIAYLENLSNSPNGKGVVSGKILEYDVRYKFEREPIKPKEIEKVFLESADKEKLETVLDAAGSYSFYGLERGIYEISVLAPERLIERDEFDSDYFYGKGFRKVKKKLKILGSSCSVSEYFSFDTNGIITGKVFDSNGKPLKSIPIILFRYDDLDNMPEHNMKVWTNERGVYIAKGLPPARYRVGFGIANSLYINSHFAGFTPVYYPNSLNEKGSIQLDLKEAEILTDINIQLFPKLEKRKITGQVYFENGQPAKNVDGTFYVRRKVSSDRIEGGYDLKINSEGKFEIEVYDQTEYWILARVFDSENWRTRKISFSSKCYKISKNQNLSPMRIILKKDSSNCDVDKL